MTMNCLVYWNQSFFQINISYFGVLEDTLIDQWLLIQVVSFIFRIGLSGSYELQLWIRQCKSRLWIVWYRIFEYFQIPNLTEWRFLKLSKFNVQNWTYWIQNFKHSFVMIYLMNMIKALFMESTESSCIIICLRLRPL